MKIDQAAEVLREVNQPRKGWISGKIPLEKLLILYPLNNLKQVEE